MLDLVSALPCSQIHYMVILSICSHCSNKVNRCSQSIRMPQSRYYRLVCELNICSYYLYHSKKRFFPVPNFLRQRFSNFFIRDSVVSIFFFIAQKNFYLAYCYSKTKELKKNVLKILFCKKKHCSVKKEKMRKEWYWILYRISSITILSLNRTSSNFTCYLSWVCHSGKRVEQSCVFLLFICQN